MMNESFNQQRVQQNIAVLAELATKKPRPDVLKKYSGWGGLRNAIFTPEIYCKLKRYLSEQTITSIKNSTGNAYYTPQKLIEFIYDALVLLNRPFENILEPAAGNGLFFEYMPQAVRNGAKISAIEPEEVSCRLIRALYPDVLLHQGGFELWQPDTTFDLIIGNPPYGREILKDARHPDLEGLRIHHYFVAKCMRLLAPSGILAMVLPRWFMDNVRDHARDIIQKEGGSLLAAFRLPDNLFVDAKVTVDVVFLVKEKGPDDWLYFDRNIIGRERVQINRYFSENPSHIIGELGIVEAYGRPELTCHQQEGEDVIARLRQQLAHFPPKKLPTIEQHKALLAKRLAAMDREIQHLSVMKGKLIQAQRELHMMERNFLQQCDEKIRLDISI